VRSNNVTGVHTCALQIYFGSCVWNLMVSTTACINCSSFLTGVIAM
jgi:hypothetical protein